MHLLHHGECLFVSATSGDDGRDKAGLPVQRDACVAFAARAGFEIVNEFADDGVTGKLPMHARPQGRLLIAALRDGAKTVLVLRRQADRSDSARFLVVHRHVQGHRDHRARRDWHRSDGQRDRRGERHACRDGSGCHGRPARSGEGPLACGGKRVEGRHPYGQHPDRAYDGERGVVERIKKLKASGVERLVPHRPHAQR